MSSIFFKTIPFCHIEEIIDRLIFLKTSSFPSANEYTQLYTSSQSKGGSSSGGIKGRP